MQLGALQLFVVQLVLDHLVSLLKFVEIGPLFVQHLLQIEVFFHFSSEQFLFLLYCGFKVIQSFLYLGVGNICYSIFACLFATTTTYATIKLLDLLCQVEILALELVDAVVGLSKISFCRR